ncbi:MAG: YbbR-like domain-containing protein, partial [Ruthenibacterium lactatiformans]
MNRNATTPRATRARAGKPPHKKEGREAFRQALARLAGDKRVLALFSLLVAFFMWFVVISVVDPNQTVTVRYVPVNLEYNSAAYESYGLGIVEKPNMTVNVRVTGDGSVVGGLEAGDLLVYPDYSSVTGVGTYTLRLIVRRADTSIAAQQYEIEGIVSNNYITLTFDEMATKTFPVTVNVIGVEPAEGYFVDTPVASPAEVTLRGPESQMSQVDKVVANVALSGQRTESALATAQLEFWDKDGNVLTDTHITTDTEQVEVTIPVLKMKEVPITLNTPACRRATTPACWGTAFAGDHPDCLAGRARGRAGKRERLPDLTKFKLGETVTLSITLPEGIRNLDALQSVDVTFDTYGFATRTVTVSQITVVNAPSDTTVTVTTRRLSDVTLVGPEDELDALSEANVVAQVDASASNINVSKGQQSMPVTIVVPGSSTVFATGSYEVLCD